MPLGLILKKLLARMLFPVPMVLLVLGVGTWLVLAKKSSPRRKTVGKWLLIGGMGYLLVCSVFGSFLLDRLERSYPVFRIGAWFDVSQEYVIGVAGNAYYADPAIPEACRFNDHMLLRLWEAGRIARLFKTKSVRCRIVVSQPNKYASVEQRLAALRAYFAIFNIMPEQVELVDGCLNTRQEVLAFRKYPGQLILVSEAFHPNLRFFYY